MQLSALFLQRYYSSQYILHVSKLNIIADSFKRKPP